MVEVRELHEAIKAGRLTEAFGLGTAATISPIARWDWKTATGTCQAKTRGPWPRGWKRRLDEVRTGAGEILRLEHSRLTPVHWTMARSFFLMLLAWCGSHVANAQMERTHIQGAATPFALSSDYRALGFNLR